MIVEDGVDSHPYTNLVHDSGHMAQMAEIEVDWAHE